jgi:hypothetical protein
MIKPKFTPEIGEKININRNCGVDVRTDGKSIIFKEVDNDNKG